MAQHDDLIRSAMNGGGSPTLIVAKPLNDVQAVGMLATLIIASLPESVPIDGTVIDDACMTGWKILASAEIQQRAGVWQMVVGEAVDRHNARRRAANEGGDPSGPAGPTLVVPEN